MHRGNDHVEKCRPLVGDPIAEFVHLAGEGRAVLRHPAGIELHLAPALSMAQVLGLAAEVFLARPAEMATAAGDEGVDPHTPADQVSIRIVVDVHHRARQLVSENDVGRVGDLLLQRLFGPRILSPEVTNITAADPALADFHQHHPRFEPGHRHVHDFERLNRFENQCFH